MINGNLRRAFPYRLILSVLMGVVIFYLAVNFVVQTGERLDLRDRLRRVEQEIAAAEKANAEPTVPTASCAWMATVSEPVAVPATY